MADEFWSVERRRRRRLLDRRLVAITVLAVAGASFFAGRLSAPDDGRPGPGTNIQAGDRPSRREAYLRGLTNGLRYEKERSVLPWWDAGQECARIYARHLAETGVLAHSTSTKACPWNGENVGQGSTINQVHQAFTRSDNHRSNLLFRGWSRVAIAAVYDGRFWWVVERFKV